MVFIPKATTRPANLEGSENLVIPDFEGAKLTIPAGFGKVNREYKLGVKPAVAAERSLILVNRPYHTPDGSKNNFDIEKERPVVHVKKIELYAVLFLFQLISFSPVTL